MLVVIRYDVGCNFIRYDVGCNSNKAAAGAYYTWHCCAGLGANVYFRFMDQSDPAIQGKMKAAYEQLLAVEYISAELSPSSNWLTAFQAYAEQQGAANVDGEGAVRQDVFYDLLPDFLAAQVLHYLE